MKIAIASQDRKTITGHAGQCRRFWIYEVPDNALETAPADSLPAPSAEAPAPATEAAAPADSPAPSSPANPWETVLATKQLLELAPAETLHHTAPSVGDRLREMDVLIATGMGSGLQQRLAKSDIVAKITSETDPDRAVTAYLEGTLPDAPPEAETGHCRSDNHESEGHGSEGAELDGDRLHAQHRGRQQEHHRSHHHGHHHDRRHGGCDGQGRGRGQGRGQGRGAGCCGQGRGRHRHSAGDREQQVV